MKNWKLIPISRPTQATSPAGTTGGVGTSQQSPTRGSNKPRSLSEVLAAKQQATAPSAVAALSNATPGAGGLQWSRLGEAAVSVGGGGPSSGSSPVKLVGNTANKLRSLSAGRSRVSSSSGSSSIRSQLSPMKLQASSARQQRHSMQQQTVSDRSTQPLVVTNEDVNQQPRSGSGHTPGMGAPPVPARPTDGHRINSSKPHGLVPSSSARDVITSLYADHPSLAGEREMKNESPTDAYTATASADTHADNGQKIIRVPDAVAQSQQQRHDIVVQQLLQGYHHPAPMVDSVMRDVVYPSTEINSHAEGSGSASGRNVQTSAVTFEDIASLDNAKRYILSPRTRTANDADFPVHTDVHSTVSATHILYLL